jgi:hypothetical protein
MNYLEILGDIYDELIALKGMLCMIGLDTDATLAVQNSLCCSERKQQ